MDSHAGSYTPPFDQDVEFRVPSTESSLLEGVKALPTIFIDEAEMMLLSTSAINRCLANEFNTSRLDCIHKHLWWAGRPVPARALSRQKLHCREIVITEQADLHLVWTGNRIFIKPLPLFLLQYQFWETYLGHDEELHEQARGFLLSYVWLVRHKSDFYIAKQHNLLPDFMTWDQWKTLVESISEHVDFNCLGAVDKRYTYGELRLNRLNHIYRFAPQFRLRHLLRGYASSYHTYTSFFTTNFRWLLILFAYGTIILSAMQVGLATDVLGGSVSFQQAAYGFAILSVLLPLALAILIGLLYVLLFLFYIHITLAYEKERENQRTKWRSDGQA